MNRSESHVCDSKCIAERARLAPLDTYFAQCFLRATADPSDRPYIEGRTQLRVGMNERFECPRVQSEFETLCALCSIAAMTRPDGRKDMRNED